VILGSQSVQSRMLGGCLFFLRLGIVGSYGSSGNLGVSLNVLYSLMVNGSKSGTIGSYVGSYVNISFSGKLGVCLLLLASISLVANSPWHW